MNAGVPLLVIASLLFVWATAVTLVVAAVSASHWWSRRGRAAWRALRDDLRARFSRPLF